MARALELAGRGLFSAAPNPVVGAVLVREGELVGEGFHRAAGEPHAETHALQQAGERARGATLYVTLEPCIHQGRTPPCAPAVIAAGIRRVVVGCVDPDPRVAGGGLRLLAEAGLTVDRASSELVRSCALQNQFFLASASNGLPFLTLKYAMSLDGKTASHTGHSRWISGPVSRLSVHRERALHQAVLVGIGTALADDPQLNVRGLEGVRQPLRVVVDSRARLSLASRLLDQPGGATWVAVGPEAAPDRVQALRERGARIEVLPLAQRSPGQDQDQGLDLFVLLERLQANGIRSVLAECGGELASSLWRQRLITRLLVFVAPIMIGGRTAPSPLGGPGLERVDQAVPLHQLSHRSSGADIEVEGYVDLSWLQV